MTPDDYVQYVLNKYAVQTGSSSPAAQAANAVYPHIQQWASSYLAECQYSGSYAKGTAVRGTTDVDLFISLTSNTPGTLKDIYTSLLNYPPLAIYQPRPQNVSVGLTVNGLQVDLVPARKQEGFVNYHSLYRRKQDTWTQTNIQQHISTVRDSGRTPEIRAIKIWRQLHTLEFPSFYLELTVINALSGRSTAMLGDNVWCVLTYLRDRLEAARVEDPSNTNNVVSEDLTQTERRKVAVAAGVSLQQSNWAAIIW